MDQSGCPDRSAQCQVCGSMVLASYLTQCLLADARLLRLIKASNPDWDREKCEYYLRSLSIVRPEVKAAFK